MISVSIAVSVTVTVTVSITVGGSRWDIHGKKVVQKGFNLQDGFRDESAGDRVAAEPDKESSSESELTKAGWTHFEFGGLFKADAIHFSFLHFLLAVSCQ